MKHRWKERIWRWGCSLKKISYESSTRQFKFLNEHFEKERIENKNYTPEDAQDISANHTVDIIWIFFILQ